MDNATKRTINAIPAKSGENTTNQGQLITPTNFNTKNITNNTSHKPITGSLLSVTVYYFIIAC